MPPLVPPRTHHQPPALSFSHTTPETLKREAADIKHKFIQSIEDAKKHDSREDRFAALSLALGDASTASVRVTLPSMVHADADVRAASNSAKDYLKNMFDEALSNEELYQHLLPVDGDGVNKENINGNEDARFQFNILRTLRRNGCGLGKGVSTRSTVLEKRRKIEELCTNFCAVINEHDECLLFANDELAGIGDIDRYPIDEATGKRTVSLKAPDTTPVLKFASNSDTRRRVTEASSRKCQKVNTQRFVEVLKLRDECAKILGYKSHSEYMCEIKMVATPENAESFLLELVDAYEPLREREMALLLDMKRQDVGGETVALEQWDMLYYTGKYTAECAGVDEAALRSYFPLEFVKKTICAIYEKLLGLKFELVDDAQVWHEDVECYAVRSSREENEVIGHFYLDIHPRTGKYSHQCVYPLRPSYSTKDGRVLPACVNVGNLTPSREGSPSMLLFREVEVRNNNGVVVRKFFLPSKSYTNTLQTFFHEFGHVMHCVLTNARHSLHSWAWSAVPWYGGVEQDMLEVPSMMLENFVWQPEVLRLLSKHEKDGSCLSERDIEALSESRFLMTGYTRSKYLAMALYDLKVHSGVAPYEFEGNEYDAISLYNAMIEKYTGVAPIQDSFAAASWFHLLMG